MKKRLFVAIQLPKGVKDAFIAYAKGHNARGIRWTTPENLHITVYFLGYVDERDLPVVTKRIENALAHLKSFELEFMRIEFAPPNRPARMIWAVFEEKIARGQYKLLVDSIHEALKDFSHKDYRGKETIAHVTLARFHDPSIARRVLLRQPDIKEKVFAVSSCDLMESKLSREGPAYTVLKSFQFSKYI